MGDTLSATLGFAGSWDIYIPDDQGNPFDLLSATLDAEVWRGDDQAELFSPSIVAIADQPGYATVSWTPANLAGKDPGLYPLVVGVDVDGVRYLGFEGFLEIGRGPGSATAPKVYGSADALFLAADQIGLVLDRSAGLAAGLDVRAEAREEADRRIVDACIALPGFVLLRSATWDPAIGSHDIPDHTLSPPDKDEIRVHLDADRLEVDERLVEMCSWFAASLVFRRQVAGGRGGGEYRALADDLMARFEAAWRKYRPRIDATSVGAGRFELGRGKILYLVPPEAP